MIASHRDVQRAATAVTMRTDMGEQPPRVSYGGVEMKRCEGVDGEVWYEWTGTVRVQTGARVGEPEMRHKVYVGADGTL